MTCLLFLIYFAAGCAFALRLANALPFILTAATGCALGLAWFLFASFFFGFILGIQVGAWATLFFGVLLLGAGFRLCAHERQKSVAGFCVATSATTREYLRAGNPQELGAGLFAFLVSLSGFSYLSYNHYLQPREDGLYSAGVTAGDLTLHAAIAHSFAFGDNLRRLEYPFLDGQPMGYPFLSDLQVAVGMALGDSFRSSYAFGTIITVGFLVLVLCALALEWLKNHKVSLLVLPTIFFFSGGMGFLFFAEDLFMHGDFTGLLSSTNYTFISQAPEGEAWRMLSYANVVGNLFLASRSACFGVPICLTAILLLCRGGGEKNVLLLAGILIGILPLVHPHSFMVGAGVWIWVTFHRYMKNKIWERSWSISGGAILGLSALQLGWISFHVSKSASFIHWRPGWTYMGDSIGGFLLFWFFNGAPLLVVGLALIPFAERRLLRLVTPLLLLFIPANLISFSPWPYDNIKLLMYFHLGLCLVVVDVLFRARRSLILRLGAWLVVLICALSGILAVAHEGLSKIGVTPNQDLDIVTYFQEQTPEEALVLTGSVMYHPVTMYSGRRLFFGTEKWLAAHGVPFDKRKAEARAIYEAKDGWQALVQNRAIDFIVIGPYERAEFQTLNEAALREFAAGAETIGPHLVLRMK
jgi:hypothetical protein